MIWEKKKKRIQKKRIFNMNSISNPASFLLKALSLLIDLSYFIPISYKLIYNIWIQILLIKSRISLVSQYFLSNFTKTLDSFLIQAGKMRTSAINLLSQYSTGVYALSHYFSLGCLSSLASHLFSLSLTLSDSLPCRNALHLRHTKKLL